MLLISATIDSVAAAAHTPEFLYGYRQGQNDSKAGLDGDYCYREFCNNQTQIDQCNYGYNTGGEAGGHYAPRTSEKILELMTPDGATLTPDSNKSSAYNSGFVRKQ